MKREYLGDAYDHWKGSLISILTNKKKIRLNLAVEPMLTDPDPWEVEDLQTYRRLLNLPVRARIFHRNETFINRHGIRQPYFAGLPNGCDLFLDPDVGISTRNHADGKHVTIHEIAQLLADRQNCQRVLMIYQQLAHRSVCRQRQRIKQNLRRLNPRPRYCVYQCGQVAMLFISRNEKRIDAIRETLRRYLRGTAAGRIWPLP